MQFALTARLGAASASWQNQGRNFPATCCICQEIGSAEANQYDEKTEEVLDSKITSKWDVFCSTSLGIENLLSN